MRMRVMTGTRRGGDADGRDRRTADSGFLGNLAVRERRHVDDRGRAEPGVRRSLRDAASWTTRRAHPAGPGRETAVVHAFPIDGTEQRAVSPPRACLADTGTMSSMAWDGTALVYTLVSTIGPGGTPGSSVGLKSHLSPRSAGPARDRDDDARLGIGTGAAGRIGLSEVDRRPRRGATAGRGRYQGHDRGRVVDRGALGRGHVAGRD